MKDISIVANGNDLRTDSRDLASLLDHRHRSIFANITKYKDELESLGQVRFEKALGIYHHHYPLQAQLHFKC